MSSRTLLGKYEYITGATCLATPSACVYWAIRSVHDGKSHPFFGCINSYRAAGMPSSRYEVLIFLVSLGKGVRGHAWVITLNLSSKYATCSQAKQPGTSGVWPPRLARYRNVQMFAVKVERFVLDRAGHFSTLRSSEVATVDIILQTRRRPRSHRVS